MKEIIKTNNLLGISTWRCESHDKYGTTVERLYGF